MHTKRSCGAMYYPAIYRVIQNIHDNFSNLSDLHNLNVQKDLGCCFLFVAVGCYPCCPCLRLENRGPFFPFDYIPCVQVVCKLKHSITGYFEYQHKMIKKKCFFAQSRNL